MFLTKLMTDDTDCPLFHCSVCDMFPSSKAEWISHANGRAHVAKIEKISLTRDNTDDIRLKVISQSKQLLAHQSKFVEIGAEEDRCMFFCLLCDVKVTSYFALSDHLENELHGMKVRAYQSLKEEKDKIVGANNDETLSVHDRNTADVATGSEVRYSVEELLSKSENVGLVLKELNQFFSGTLRCVNCQQSITVDPEIVTDHLKRCFLKEVADECSNEEIDIRKAFSAFMQMSENKNRLDDLRIVLNQPVSQCDELEFRIATASFQDLQSETKQSSIMAPHSFKCLKCDLTGSMKKWEDHFLRHHSTLSNGSRVTNDTDSIICTCTLCQVMLFGQREEIIKHEPCISKGDAPFFLFSSYPQLRAVMYCDHPLPRYYRFLNKHASTKSMQTAFFCLSCDFYGLNKLKKHFQSKDHKSKIHPMFEFLYCTVCSILFYANRLLFEDHCHTPAHICSNSSVESKAICASKYFVGRGHEDLLISIKKDILKCWTSRPLDDVQSLIFWCDPCLYHTNNLEEWRKVHLICESHVEKMKQKEYFEHACVLCKINSIGCPEFHANHYASEIHKNIKKEAFYNFNGSRMAEKRSSVHLELTSVLEKRTDSNLVMKDENSNERENNVNECEQFPKISIVESSTNGGVDTKVIDEKSYNLEHEPYSLKINCSNDINKELIQEFLGRVNQKLGLVCKVKNYFCAFCGYYSSRRSWWPHLKSPEHKNAILNHQKDSKNKNGQRSIIFCSLCMLFGLGRDTIRNLHMTSKTHKKMVTKAKLGKNTTCGSSPISSLSTTDGDEEILSDGNGTLLKTTDINSSSNPKNADTTVNGSDDETNEDENMEDELYEMIMREESDTEGRVVSDDELDKSVLKQVKNDTNSNTRVLEEVSKGGNNEVENRENSDVEYSLVVSGIPALIMKKRALLKETFSKFVQFDRTFVKKSKPNSIYLVVSKDLTDSYSRLKENLVQLKAKWGTDELTVDVNTEEKFELSGMRDRLLEPAVILFSNRKELTNAVRHMINRYDAEANSSHAKNRIYELQMVVAHLAGHLYKNYNVIVKTHVFGSRVTGLAAENSDVDIYLQIGLSFRGLISNNVDLQQQLVVLFAKEMRNHPRDFCDITSIPFARVPIVKFKHIKSNLNCDLSFKSGLSTMNSMLVKTYLELDERIKYLVCAVKLWMKLNDLADRNLFTTYAQIWMVLFFLMQADIAVIPTVIKLKNMLPLEQQILTVEGWNCSFPNIRNIVWRSSCTLTGEELLCKFFMFYSNHSLINYVLCTLTGLKLEKKYFMKYYDSLPEIFRMFKFRIEEDRVLFRKISNDFESFCVQDPFDHCHNLTKTINVRKFEAFVELCKQTVELLKT